MGWRGGNKGNRKDEGEMVREVPGRREVSNEWKEGAGVKGINGRVEDADQERSGRENSNQNQNKEGEVEQRGIEKKGNGRKIMRWWGGGGEGRREESGWGRRGRPAITPKRRGWIGGEKEVNGQNGKGSEQKKDR